MTKQAKAKSKWLEDNLAYLYGNGGVADPGPYIPSAPRNLAAADAGGGNYDLTWDVPISDGGQALIGYNVYQNDSLLTTVPAPAGGLSAVAAVDGDTFYVKAVNGIGEGGRSNIVTISSAPVTTLGMLGDMLGGMLGRMLGRGA